MEKDLEYQKLNLNDRDVNLISIIEEEKLTNFTFEGLKRRIKLHPETLSRILHRLVEQGIVKKEKKGYTLTNKAKMLLNLKSSESNNSNQRLLQTFLPKELPIKKIIIDLKGKWFGELRYLGHSITNESITLKWITQNGGNVISAIFFKNRLFIDAKILSDNDHDSALNSSHQLMGYITKLISKLNYN